MKKIEKINIETYNYLLNSYNDQVNRVTKLTKEIEYLKRDNVRLECRRSALEWALVLAQSMIRDEVNK